MQFGLLAPGATGSGADAVDLARQAEALGFESLWMPEHVIVPADYDSPYPYSDDGKIPGNVDSPIADPLIWLAMAAAVTERIRLGTGILLVPERNPVVTAKAVATLDHLSGGRVDLGIGVGWMEEEFDALGVPWARRGARTDDYVAAMRSLWADRPASHDGEFISFDRVHCEPKPTNGSVPIIIGGSSDVAARRAARMGDGFYPYGCRGDQLAYLVVLMRKEADAAGRDPESIEVITDMHRNGLDRLELCAGLGINRVIMRPMRPSDMEAFGQVIAQHAD